VDRLRVEALVKSRYEELLSAAGYEEVSAEVTHVYSPEQIAGSLRPEGVETLCEVPVASAFVRAQRSAE
jgi:hypothetical protein